MRRHWFAALLLTVAILGICTVAYASTAYCVRINIRFSGNLIFSKYDVDFYLNDLKMENLPHGKNYTGRFYAERGFITLHFYEHGSKTVHGSLNVEIKGDTIISLSISCHEGRIDVYNVSVSTEETQHDGTTGPAEATKQPVTVTAAPSPSPIQSAAVTATPTERPTVRPTSKPISTSASVQSTATRTPEPPLSKATAMKVVTTAIGNYMSLDVFTDDGNNYDANKFHSYSECEKMFTVYSEGEWSITSDGKGWRVEGLIIKDKDNRGFSRYCFDVRFDGENYVCENGSAEGARKLEWLMSKDPSKYSYDDLSNIEWNAFCIVSPAQIKD